MGSVGPKSRSMACAKPFESHCSSGAPAGMYWSTNCSTTSSRMPLNASATFYARFPPGRPLDGLHARRIPEYPHQIIFQRQIEAARSRIASAAGPATQLVIDAPRFVPLGADDVQAARIDHLLMAFAPRGVNPLQVG